jgi:16S rRNA (uracil1498-N3)-methyltransferase
MHLFFCPEITPSSYTLSEEESKHCVRVLRLKPGDMVQITDGAGSMHECRIIDDHPKRCSVEIVSTELTPSRSNNRLHIAIAPTKNIERFEWFLEKATEIGIDEITPIYCNHSERTVIKLPRLEKVVASAMKQSLRSFLPKLNEPKEFNDFIREGHPEQKFIAWCETGKEQHLKDLHKPGTDTLILIGPEGDFSTLETETAIGAGYIPVSLGPTRLRTETAGVVACTIIELNGYKK